MNQAEALIKGLEDPVFQDNSIKFAKEQAFGKKLMVTAWLVEILAASLGLLIAFFVAFDAYNKHEIKDTSTTLNAILGALPFLLIAVIEPTKIPLAGGLYKVKHLGWKTLFLFALVGLTLVTFETMFTGLERQLTNVTSNITDGKNEVRTLREKRGEIANRIAEFEGLDIATLTNEWNEKIQTNSEQVDANRKEQIEVFNVQLASLQENLKAYESSRQVVIDEFNRNNQLRLNALQGPIDDLSDQIEVERDKRIVLDQQLREISSSQQEDPTIVRLMSQIAQIQSNVYDTDNLLSSNEDTQIKLAQARIGVTQDGRVGTNTRANFERWKQQQLAGIAELEIEITRRRDELSLQSSGYRQDLVRQIEMIDASIVALQSDLNERSAALVAIQLEVAAESVPPQMIQMETTSIDSTRELISELRNAHNLELDRIVAEGKKKQLEYEQSRRQVELQLSEQKQSVPELRARVDELDEEIQKRTQEMRSEALNNQVYRFAQKYMGHEDILEVAEKELDRVALFWFGSIAFISSVIGTILALIANIMTDPDAFVDKQRSRRRHPLRNSIRLMMLALRRKILVRPKTIEKKVEVEKLVEVEKFVDREVEKIVEVQVEKVVPELVAVPIFLPSDADPDIEMERVSKHYASLKERIDTALEPSKTKKASS